MTEFRAVAIKVPFIFFNAIEKLISREESNLNDNQSQII